MRLTEASEEQVTAAKRQRLEGEVSGEDLSVSQEETDRVHLKPLCTEVLGSGLTNILVSGINSVAM